MGFWPCSLESMAIDKNFWSGKSVFITGHTGFKGGWLAIWLAKLGAKVYGYSLMPKTELSFFKEVKLMEQVASSHIGDIRDLTELTMRLDQAQPEIVFHMAAQPLVRESYIAPVETFETNVIGTVNLLEAARKVSSVKAVVNITTDKCYENKEWAWPYRENDRLGGFDPYSASKACAEMVASAYRHSFYKNMNINTATVRAGNVIGGGDWSDDRLIPDFLKSIEKNQTLQIRSPNAVRPWQHVLEPLSGYLMLAESLVTIGEEFAEPWNFGPTENDAKSVEWIVNALCKHFPDTQYSIDYGEHPHEAGLLKLDSSKAKTKLGWKPRWKLEKALFKTIEWHNAWRNNQNMLDTSISQIEEYEASIL